jgi:uncharacterized NAD(P)/FAD-binding protein YdhS
LRSESLGTLLAHWDRCARPIPQAELVESLSALQLSREELAKFITFDEQSYRRMILYESPHFQALVLCWRSGQRSPIHDHHGSSCVVKILRGSATETRFHRSPCGLLVPADSREIAENTLTTCDGRCIHQMANLAPPGHDLVSLHVYSPTPSGWRSYRLEETTLSENDRLIHQPARTVRFDPGSSTGWAPCKEAEVVSSPGATRSPATIAIVGGGFSGTMVAVNLSRRADGSPIRVLLFEKRDRFARGLAYGTQCDQHLLNVPAGLMSAFPDEPTHFLDWLQARDPSAGHGTFAPRRVYGDYLESLLHDSTATGKLEPVHDEVVALREGIEPGEPFELRTSSGRSFSVDQVVLALGNPPPRDPPGLAMTPRDRGYVADPWCPEALEGLEGDETIALLGAGLTALDLVIEASARGHRGKILAISRHGLLPRAHRPVAPRPHFAMANRPRTARALLRAVRVETAECQGEGGDWRSVVDGIRPVAQTLWRSMGDGERERFVRHLATRWDVHRHRVAPDVDDAIRAMIDQGRLEVIAGRIFSFEAGEANQVLTLRRRGSLEIETIPVDRVINCTGPSRDIRESPGDLLRSLLESQIARPGPLALGLDVADSGTLIGADGLENSRIFAIGPLLKGQLWETTAVRELRCQARELADRMLNRISMASAG